VQSGKRTNILEQPNAPVSVNMKFNVKTAVHSRLRTRAWIHRMGPQYRQADTRTLTAVDYLLFSDTTRSSNLLL